MSAIFTPSIPPPPFFFLSLLFSSSSSSSSSSSCSFLFLLLEGETYYRNGTVEAPLLESGQAATYMKYQYGGKTFHVPNYGFNTRVGDWDFVYSPVERLNSIKVNRTKTKTCGRRTPDSELYKVCTSVVHAVGGSGGNASDAYSATLTVFRRPELPEPTEDDAVVRLNNNGLVRNGVYRARRASSNSTHVVWVLNAQSDSMLRTSSKASEHLHAGNYR